MVVEQQLLPYFQWLLTGGENSIGALVSFAFVFLGVAMAALVIGFAIAASRYGLLRGRDAAGHERQIQNIVSLSALYSRLAAQGITVSEPSELTSLDEKGKALSSMELARALEQWRDRGTREVRFVLGAADGHSDAERDAADLLLSFGPATWPHLLARAMLAEQLFRATSILANHPYHREG